MIAVLAFLRSPLARYLLLGLLVVGLVVGFGAWNRSAQHKRDLPAMVDAVTGKPWKDEAKAAALDLATCHGNEMRLGADLKRQNDATDAAKAEGDRMAALVAQGRQAARKSALAAQSAGEALKAYTVKGADACARMLDVDAQVREIQP